MNFTFETQKPAKTTNQDVHSGDYSIESHRIAVNLLAATLERHISVGGGRTPKALVLTLGHSGPWHHSAMDRSAQGCRVRLECDDCS